MEASICAGLGAMQDMELQLEKLRLDAEDCALIKNRNCSVG